MFCPYYLSYVEQTLTVKYRLFADDVSPFIKVSECYCDVCNFISQFVYENYDENSIPTRFDLQKKLYGEIRKSFPLKSQMVISSIRTVLARYATLITTMSESQKEHAWWEKRKSELEARGESFRKSEPHIQKWKLIVFKAHQCDLVSDRDWSFVEGGRKISINTLGNRIKVMYSDKGFEKYRSCRHGTAKLVIRRQKVFLYVSVTVTLPDETEKSETVVGIDSGLRFMVTTYDGEKTTFHRGGKIKNKRLQYRRKRRELQKRNTPSSRRRQRLIGNRENRWMDNYLHCLAKTLVNQFPSGTVFVMEDLSGAVGNLVKVVHERRSYLVSWPYRKFIDFLSYKAKLRGQRVLLVNASRTSSTCPVCGKESYSARSYRMHEYHCECGYRSNDDRAAAINIRKRGLDKIKRSQAV